MNFNSRTQFQGGPIYSFNLRVHKLSQNNTKKETNYIAMQFITMFLLLFFFLLKKKEASYLFCCLIERISFINER
jgi:hypothetical protein